MRLPNYYSLATGGYLSYRIINTFLTEEMKRKENKKENKISRYIYSRIPTKYNKTQEDGFSKQS